MTALQVGGIVTAFALSLALTRVVRRYAIARAVLDIPNDRSSHTVPTPRGGGVAIAVATLVIGLLATYAQWYELDSTIALLGGAAIVGAIGWIDDLHPLSATLRFAVHVGAAAGALFLIGGLPSVRVGEGVVQLGGVGTALGIMGVVCCINFYNFMDGTDGLAGAEAVSVSAIGGLLLLSTGDASTAFLSFTIAAASLGFLVWNWPPASIFMGDVGSGLLGFLFAVLAILSEKNGSVPLLTWVLLLGVFVFDATVTLIRRALRGERVYEAHRSHAYQRLVQAGFTHRQVALFVILVNLTLGICAAAGVMYRSLLLPSFIAGFVMLACLYGVVERLHPMKPRTNGSAA
jgi:Fuc2NAc and GlcNAc transferase